MRKPGDAIPANHAHVLSPQFVHAKSPLIVLPAGAGKAVQRRAFKRPPERRGPAWSELGAMQMPVARVTSTRLSPRHTDQVTSYSRLIDADAPRVIVPIACGYLICRKVKDLCVIATRYYGQGETRATDGRG